MAVAKLPDSIANASVGVKVVPVSGVSVLALVFVAFFLAGGVMSLSLLLSESLSSLPEGVPGGLRDRLWPSLFRVEYPVVGFRDGLLCLSDSVTFLDCLWVSFFVSVSRAVAEGFTILFPVWMASSCWSRSD